MMRCAGFRYMCWKSHASLQRAIKGACNVMHNWEAGVTPKRGLLACSGQSVLVAQRDVRGTVGAHLGHDLREQVLVIAAVEDGHVLALELVRLQVEKPASISEELPGLLIVPMHVIAEHHGHGRTCVVWVRRRRMVQSLHDRCHRVKTHTPGPEFPFQAV